MHKLLNCNDIRHASSLSEGILNRRGHSSISSSSAGVTRWPLLLFSVVAAAKFRWSIAIPDGSRPRLWRSLSVSVVEDTSSSHQVTLSISFFASARCRTWALVLSLTSAVACSKCSALAIFQMHFSVFYTSALVESCQNLSLIHI